MNVPDQRFTAFNKVYSIQDMDEATVAIYAFPKGTDIFQFESF